MRFMKTVIWYNTEKGIYDFGTSDDYLFVGKEFDLIFAEEFIGAPLTTVSNITQKLNRNIALTKNLAA